MIRSESWNNSSKNFVDGLERFFGDRQQYGNRYHGFSGLFCGFKFSPMTSMTLPPMKAMPLMAAEPRQNTMKGGINGFFRVCGMDE